MLIFYLLCIFKKCTNFSGILMQLLSRTSLFSLLSFISNESILPERPISFSNSTWSLMKGVPINLDNEGCLDLVSTSDSWSDSNTQKNYLFSIINTNCTFWEWCPMPESNRHSRRNAILNRARLPIPPMGLVGHCS